MGSSGPTTDGDLQQLGVEGADLEVKPVEGILRLPETAVGGVILEQQVLE